MVGKTSKSDRLQNTDSKIFKTKAPSFRSACLMFTSAQVLPVQVDIQAAGNHHITG